ncbi:hypothetical protein H5410_002656 [Solanum commersonii]|uniref:Uncharacterized protein n=1 Tax=Solanum commersonii TaxID=4109 RepID=A0A9J6B2W1_SOLCO|nr:hypothetical protein H5410_002656 [Solanum commersonii]
MKLVFYIIILCFLYLASFILPNNTGITFASFQKFGANDVATISIHEINNLISQNNYLGLYVKFLDFIFKPPFGLEGLLDKKNSEFSAKSMNLSETLADELEQAFDYKEHVALEVNKLRVYPKKNSGNPQFSHKPSMQTYYNS